MSIDRQTFVRAGKIAGVGSLVSAAALGLTLLGQVSAEQSKVFTPLPPDQCPLGEQIDFGLGSGPENVEMVLRNSQNVSICLTREPINGTIFTGRAFALQYDNRSLGSTIVLPDPKDNSCIQNDAARICAKRIQSTDKEGNTTEQLSYDSPKPVMADGQGSMPIFTVQHQFSRPDGKTGQLIGVSRIQRNNQPPPLPPWGLPVVAASAVGTLAGLFGLLRAKNSNSKASNAKAEAESSRRAAESARAQATRVIEDTRNIRAQAQNALREREGYLKQIRDLDKQLHIKTDVGDAATTSNQALRDKINTLEAIIAENKSDKK